MLILNYTTLMELRELQKPVSSLVHGNYIIIDCKIFHSRSKRSNNIFQTNQKDKNTKINMKNGVNVYRSF
jgi:tartrate dehydratase beta subunit/fumarate hydratase class I family protein